MSAKLLLLSTYWGFIVIALVSVVFVLTGVEWRGGNAQMPWFFLLLFVLFFLCFLVYWRQRPRPLARYVARSVRAQDDKVTVDEAAAMVQKYSPLMLVASLVFLVGSILAFITY